VTLRAADAPQMFNLRATRSRMPGAMRWALALLGALLTAVGAVWILQGSGVLPGGFMTGQSVWLWIGIVCAVVGVVLLFRGLRSARR
jgi:hypothetical protein